MNDYVNSQQQVTITVATQVWEHPDGEFRIYRLQARLADGNLINLSTYSDDLTAGWQGIIAISLNKRGELMAKPHTRTLVYQDKGDYHYNDFDLDWSHKE